MASDSGTITPTVVGGAAAPRWTALAPGTEVGRYKIVAVLGHGGMGVIYRARDPALSRDVALKLLHPYQAFLPRADERHARLLTEARVLARLSHPNVVAAYDVGTHDGAVFVAMELVDGESLRVWLERPRRRREVIDALVGAGRGLAAAHDAGVLHRDFKPANVMVSPDGRARVVDFGLARSASEEDGAPDPSDSLGAEPSRAGTIGGTPGYMSPEQVAGEPLDARTDQFSFAATVFYALTGTTPYRAPSLDAYRAAIATGDRTPWRCTAAGRATAPRRLRRVVERGLGPREQRYPSMSAMVDALAAARRPARLWISAAILVAGLAVAWHVLAQARDPRDADSTCAVPATALDDTWSLPRRMAVLHAFLGTERHHAAETFGKVAAHLDTFARAWRAMREESCDATRGGHQTPRTVELRNACLDRSRAQVRTFVELLMRADAKLVDGAVSATSELTSASECGDTAALARAADPLPADPDRRAAIAQVELALDEVRALRAAGRPQPGLERAAVVQRAADDTGYLPVRARAQFELAALEDRAGKRADSERHLRGALELAARAGDSVLAASIASGLLHSIVVQSRWREAEVLVPVVASHILLAGDLPDQRWVYLRDQAAVQARAGNAPDRALETLAAAAAACAQLSAERAATCRSSVKKEQAFTLLEREDYVGAARALDEVVTATRELYGPDHPLLVAAYTNLANARAEGRDRDGALAALAESQRVADTLPPGMLAAAYIPLAEGRIWTESGNCARALAPLRRARQQLSALLGENANEVIVADQRLGVCLLELGRPADALPHLQRWSDARRAENAQPAWRAEADFALARASWSVPARRPRAIALARGAIALYREHGTDVAEPIAAIERWLAQVGIGGRLRGREIR